MLYQFRQKIHLWILKRKIQQIKIEHQVVAWQNVKSAGILLSAATQNDIDIAFTWIDKLKEKGITIQVLFYPASLKLKLQLPKDTIVLSPKKINWLFFPKSDADFLFSKTPFDLLINLYPTNCLPLEYLSAISPSIFRVGQYHLDKAYCSDFMIKIEKSDTFAIYAEKLFFYLFKIK